MVFLLNKLKSLLPLDALCHVWLKLTQRCSWKRCVNIHELLSLFAIISPWKRAWSVILQPGIPISKNVFVLSLLIISPVDQEKKTHMSTIATTTTTTTDNENISIRKVLSGQQKTKAYKIWLQGALYYMYDMKIYISEKKFKIPTKVF